MKNVDQDAAEQKMHREFEEVEGEIRKTRLLPELSRKPIVRYSRFAPTRYT